MAAIDAFGIDDQPLVGHFRQLKLPHVFERPVAAFDFFEHFLSGGDSPRSRVAAKVPFTSLAVFRANVGDGGGSAALPLPDSFVGDCRFLIVCGAPCEARLMIGIKGAGVEKLERIR